MQRGGGKMAAMVKAGQLMDITGSITDATKKVISAGSFKAQTIDNKIYAMPVAVLPGRLLLQQGPVRQGRHHPDTDHARRAQGARSTS